MSILITGANRGIGNGILSEIIKGENEKTIYLCLRSKEKFDSTIESLEQEVKSKCQFKYLEIDLNDSTAVDSAVNQLVKDKVSLNTVINNAAVLYWEKIPGVSRKTLDINFLNVKKFNDKLLEHNLIAKEGHIIFLSTVAGNINIITDNTWVEKLKKAKLIDLEQLAEDFIHQADVEGKIEKLIGYTKKLPKEYSFSKLLINIYVRLLVESPRVKENAIFVNSIFPGFVKTDMAGEMGIVSISQGARPVIECIGMDKEQKEKVNGLLLTDKLIPLDVMDESVDFFAYKPK